MNDFRVDYLEEARECIRANHKIMRKYPRDWQTYPEFWANLLGAVANSNVAAASDDVAEQLVYRQAERTALKNELDKALAKR